jgi:hypothetical protein
MRQPAICGGRHGADGQIVDCDAEKNPDLFWALRGGGGNFGVVTSARVRLHLLPLVLAGSIIFPWTNARAALEQFGALMLQATADFFASAVLAIGPGGKPVVVISLVWTGERALGEKLVAEIAATGSPVLVKVEAMPAASLLSLTDGKLTQGNGYEVATRWLRALTPDTVAALVEAFEARSSDLSSIIIHHCHGAATQIAGQAAAFGMREPHFTALIYGSWAPQETEPDAHRNWAKQTADSLAMVLPGGYANLLADNMRAQTAHAFGGNGQRLSALKVRFDPVAILQGIPLPTLHPE